MKKVCLFILAIFFFIPVQVYGVSLGSQVSGKILLQVEENGEAWYVEPTKNERLYMGRPADAFELMRSQGLGISNADLEQIPASDSALASTSEIANRLKGKILLQVEENGEAWYVYPNDAKRYFLGRPHDAFVIMKRLGLGISNTDLEAIPVSAESSDPLKQVLGLKIESAPAQEVVEQVVVPVGKYYDTNTSYSGIIIGDEECQKDLKQGLALLEKEADIYFQQVNFYIGIIECVEQGTGVYSWERPARVDVGDLSRRDGPEWIAAMFAHEACHAWLNYTYASEHSVEPLEVPYEIYGGKEAEMKCLSWQYDAAVMVGAPDWQLEWLTQVADTEWWDVPYEERYW